MTFRKIKDNMIKGWVSSLFGVATMTVTLILIFTKSIDFVWEGLAGLAIGSILLFSPRDIVRIIIEALKSKKPTE